MKLTWHFSSVAWRGVACRALPWRAAQTSLVSGWHKSAVALVKQHRGQITAFLEFYLKFLPLLLSFAFAKPTTSACLAVKFSQCYSKHFSPSVPLTPPPSSLSLSLSPTLALLPGSFDRRTLRAVFHRHTHAVRRVATALLALGSGGSGGSWYPWDALLACGPCGTHLTVAWWSWDTCGGHRNARHDQQAMISMMESMVVHVRALWRHPEKSVQSYRHAFIQAWL